MSAPYSNEDARFDYEARCGLICPKHGTSPCTCDPNEPRRRRSLAGAAREAGRPLTGKVTRIVAELGTEEMGDEGPTGRVRIVKVAELRDYGENPLGRATTLRGIKRVQAKYLIPTRWRVVKEGRVLKANETVVEMI